MFKPITNACLSKFIITDLECSLEQLISTGPKSLLSKLFNSVFYLILQDFLNLKVTHFLTGSEVVLLNFKLKNLKTTT